MSTAKLATTPLWRTRPESLSYEERIKLSYERAKSIVEHYPMDGSVGTLLTIHYNLCLGTIAKYLPTRPDLQPIVDKLVSFEWNGQYCLTELGHGLDVINMETRATLLPDGSFELHTPTPSAAKYMPPTSPSGYPCVAIVFARLFVNGEDQGPKVFIVKLHDGVKMEPGIVSKVLSPRGSARPVKHCLTSFNHLHLPASSLLGSLSKPTDLRIAFFDSISRVISGTISMGVFAVSAIRIAAYIAAKYSLRRHVIDASSSNTLKPRSKPIMSYSTQYTPVLSAIAQALVLRVFTERCTALFVSAQGEERHFVAAVVKTLTVRTASAVLLELGDRCGAQGLMEVNQLGVLHADLRGAAIAEGDILVLSIRFAIDLLRNRIPIPTYQNPNTLLAQHERSLISSLRSSLAHTTSHRSPSIDTSILPLCQTLIEAMGARMAFESAIGVIDDDILNLFVASWVRRHGAWYAANCEGLDGMSQARLETEAAKKLVPRMGALLEMLDVEPYVAAPIVSDEEWEGYVGSLEGYAGGGTEGHRLMVGGITSKL
ncbi:acyl-CoA dehydrogenase/oxidase [Panaeolus papilionaceus]|nr:acyl-CoA dehydrogenase/oxidase [Panaeolus papilionaceus]